MSSFTWLTTPGQVPPSCTVVASGGTYFLASPTKPDIYTWNGTTLDILSGQYPFVIGQSTPFGVSILDRSGIRYDFSSPTSFTTQTFPSGISYTGLAPDGAVIDSSGNIYAPDGNAYISGSGTNLVVDPNFDSGFTFWSNNGGTIVQGGAPNGANAYQTAPAAVAPTPNT
ncbi:MAG: hypothetical protein ACYCOU_12070, partial [Sulfobacillus sp.]